jgi:hypothetical protein
METANGNGEWKRRMETANGNREWKWRVERNYFTWLHAAPRRAARRQSPIIPPP